MKLLRTVKPRISKVNSNIWSISNIMICLENLIIITALIYMISNVYRAKTILQIWFLSILAGVIIVKSGISMKWRNPIIRK